MKSLLTIHSNGQDWVPAAAGLDAERIKDVEEDEFGAKVLLADPVGRYHRVLLLLTTPLYRVLATAKKTN